MTVPIPVLYLIQLSKGDITDEIIVFKVLKGLGPGRRQHIKNVTFILRELTYDRRISNKATTLLTQCHNLKKLTVILEYDSVLTLFSHNPMGAAGVKKLREIRGVEEVNVCQGDMAVKQNNESNSRRRMLGILRGF